MSEENIQVMVRCRPLSQQEKVDGHSNVAVICNPSRHCVVLLDKKRNDNRSLYFDYVFSEESTQAEIFCIAKPLVSAAIAGFNGTIFSYGQTNAGKTYTMHGPETDPGIIPCSIHYIFESIGQTLDKKFLVQACYFEIYNEEIRDLLATSTESTRKRLEIRESPERGIHIPGLKSIVVNSTAELQAIMKIGNNNRTTGSTRMNEHSSRSHSISQLTIESSHQELDGTVKYTSGNLFLVDLAGSERQSKSESFGDRFEEAKQINLGLSALGKCIASLTDGKSTHIPYRDSRLTRMLQDSLGGSAKTLMIANISPSYYNYDETLSTLRYACRTKCVKNHPKIKEPKIPLLREYELEIDRLKSVLESKRSEVSKGTNVVSKQMEIIQNTQKRLEGEKMHLLDSKYSISSEKEILAAAVEGKAALILKENEALEKLAAELDNVESKLLIGGTNLEDIIQQQQKELNIKNLEITQEMQQSENLRNELRAKKDQNSFLKGKNSNLQADLESSARGLSKIQRKMLKVNAEMDSFIDNSRKDKESLLQTIRNLRLELLTSEQIIEHFIPAKDTEIIEKSMAFNKEKQAWYLKTPAVQYDNRLGRLTSSKYVKQPICQFAKDVIQHKKPSMRYRLDNVIEQQMEKSFH